MISDQVKRRLKSILGKENVLTRQEDVLMYAFDATNRHYLPSAVLFPSQADQISEVMHLANRVPFNVIPRGAGSGMTGGALAVKGGVILCLAKMSRILEVDRQNLIALVEPGVITSDLQAVVEDVGLFYPPDPGSVKFSTIGGNVAECAGGMRAVKYGVTRDYVRGLKVVLPTGEIIRTGVRTAKGVVGYDLTRLLVGSEGTLGIMTEIILRLLPKPEGKKTLLALFNVIDDAAAAVSKIITSGVTPSTLEFMDQACIRCVDQALGLGWPTDAEALLLIEVDGRLGQVDVEIKELAEIIAAFSPQQVTVAQTAEEVDSLWRARRSMGPALANIRPGKINEDVVVPISTIPDMIRAVEAIKSRYQINILTFGHAGDGNLHVNVLLDWNDPDETARAHYAVDDIFKQVIALGGTLSGEHGVGITKSAYLTYELNQAEIDIQKRIKRTFDPNNILNPGKIFP
ncbi:MAG: FAD-binding protein [Deltaproteobacteria bacterium]|nr:FAD-binding protein [Deltaproteobacteria bacterium]